MFFLLFIFASSVFFLFVKKRVSIRTNHYYFAPINGTPFSVAVVLPDGYGLHWFDGRMLLNKTGSERRGIKGKTG